MSPFSRDAGTSTLAWRASSPLRIRVSMSAMGSDVVILLFVLLPTGFDHTRNFPGQRQLPETDAAQPELAQEPSRPPALEAAIAVPAAQLGRLGGFRCSEPFVSSDLGGGGHRVS